MDQRKIGSFLRELRKEKGHTQEEFAESGVTEKIADFCGGFAFGMLFAAAIYTSPRICDFMDWKRKMFH